MKINLFNVLLFTFLVSAATTITSYFVLVILFNDCLSITERGEIFFWVSFAEICGIIIFSILYMVSYFLLLYSVQKKFINEHIPKDLFMRFMPLVTLIASVFALIVMLISRPGNGIEGEGWINIWLFYILSYSGLAAFVYRIKKQ